MNNRRNGIVIERVRAPQPSDCMPSSSSIHSFSLRFTFLWMFFFFVFFSRTARYWYFSFGCVERETIFLFSYFTFSFLLHPGLFFLFSFSLFSLALLNLHAQGRRGGAVGCKINDSRSVRQHTNGKNRTERNKTGREREKEPYY